jgi:hypothetical protein
MYLENVSKDKDWIRKAHDTAEAGNFFAWSPDGAVFK